MPRMAISEYAVERFVARFAEGMTLRQGRAWLEEHAQAAVHLRTKTMLGQAQYELAEPRCILVVKREGADDVLTCVTVHTAPGQYPEEDPWGCLAIADAKLPPVRPPVRLPEVVERVLPPPDLPVFPHAPPGLTLWERERLQRKEQRMTDHARENAARDARNAKAVARGLRRDRERAQLRDCLRAAVRLLVARASEGDERAKVVLEAVQATDPTYVSDAFLTETFPAPAAAPVSPAPEVPRG